jgi:hypothetical protein
LKNFSTVVLDGDACASACALAWLGGTRRYMGQDARIGFHAAREAQSGAVSGIANALVGAYLNKIGLPTQAVMYITAAKPDTIIWLNQSDAEVFGIAVEFLASRPARDRPSSGNAENRQLSPMETSAIEFVEKHVNAETMATSSEMVRDHYADIVFYYGKNLQKSAVLSEFQTFIERWPDRSYRLRPGSAQVQCFVSSAVCNVTAIIDWIAENRERGKRSQGSSTWSLSVVRQNRQFAITSINGEVLQRRITNLSSDPVASSR